MESRSILLAEDDPNDVELMLTALAEQDLADRVQVVRDGVEALDYLFQRGKWLGRTGGDPSVVLLDIKMPRIDGIEVLRQIKATPSLRHLPVVMLTSSREESDLVECCCLGANAFVVKPVEFRAFKETVRTVGVFWAMLNESATGTPCRSDSETVAPCL